ncbi:MAG: M13 family metallopeptidase [Symploca sp. SIO2E9]|nr:M13 family metallopeptidase [Symploca sp. SIO2E9]
MPQEPSPPSPRGSEPNHQTPSEVEFEQALSEVETALQTLKERYAQIKRDQRRQAQLQRRRELLKKELRSNSNRTQLQAELRQIKQQLETIELNLESHLFSWGSLQAPFWQAVRFGGLGVVIGWLLKSCA